MPRAITPATSVETLRKEAKRWLKALRADDPGARRRFDAIDPGAPPTLRAVQHALAHEYGYESWMALTQAVGRPSDARAETPLLSIDQYERAAADFVLAFNARDETALDRLNAWYERAFTFDDLWAEVWRRVYAFRQRAFRGSPNELLVDEARLIVVQDTGFGSWEALERATATGAPSVVAFVVDRRERRIEPKRRLTDAEWDDLIAAMRAQSITALDAGGLMTDGVLARVAELDDVTALALNGSRQLTDDGVRQLARMPQLQYLNLSGYPGGRLTDRGLEVLRHLPDLRTFEMTWQRGITDAGVSNLRFCDRLERVNLMGSPTGDGAIAALRGKPHLRVFRSGRLVTNAGLRMLDEFPRLRQPVSSSDSAQLLIDGPFTDEGLAALARLEGVSDLDLFWHVTAITSSGFAHLAAMPHLEVLGADGRLSDDDAMRHIAAIARLRKLRAQESVATDAGFEALSRSATLESFWGRECPNFGNRGFLAFSRMPALRELGIGCGGVDDEALAALPRFPSLRALTPIGMSDSGFRHIGRCEHLERLTCMYCRETTDEATEHIAGLRLKYYYAGLTRITDRSLETLGRMTTLEDVEFYETQGVTDAGLPFLARLPHLRAAAFDGVPGVTLEGTRVFPRRVRVRCST